MSDACVLDMATKQVDQSHVFTRRDNLQILDNQNQNYNGNQSVIDTSQFANSNKYMNYREGYLTIPMLLTYTGAGSDAGDLYVPANGGNNADWNAGLKNWYGSIIHSFTLDYNGTTICQQVPFSGLWNTFKLMTTLSLNDVKTQGSLIGFYPDTASVVGFNNAASTQGVGTINNELQIAVDRTYRQARSSARSYADESAGPANSGINLGLYNRIAAWNLDPTAGTGTGTYGTDFVSPSNLTILWKSYISNKGDQTLVGNNGIWQLSLLGIVYLKHLHSFFEHVPLLKGAFLKITLNLNNTSVSFTLGADATYPTNIDVQTALGGVCPLMLISQVLTTDDPPIPDPVDALPVGSYIVSLSVGQTCLNQTQLTQAYGGSPIGINQVGGGSITLNVPAYTWNPVYEQSYLSTGIKKVVYSDVYQFQYSNQISAGGTFNFLVSNGISNIKSVLVLPFFSKGTIAGAGVDGNMGILPFQSPFDPAGGGPTSPLVQFTQFNIQISGQNSIYNTERYSYEQFVNQFTGVNAVNGGQTDSLTSGLVGYKDWAAEYCYYYVNCGRMLPAEESVPKSINILGTSMALKPIDLYVFVEYGVEISVDLASGARV